MRMLSVVERRFLPVDIRQEVLDRRGSAYHTLFIIGRITKKSKTRYNTLKRKENWDARLGGRGGGFNLSVR